MNYIEDTARMLREELEERNLPRVPATLLGMYILLVLTEGVNTRMRHVHNAWAVEKAMLTFAHSGLVPFEELTTERQEMNRPYAEAIIATAEKLHLAQRRQSTVRDH